MSKICKITGKRPRVANNVSKANNKTKRRQLPNLQKKKYVLARYGLECKQILPQFLSGRIRGRIVRFV